MASDPLITKILQRLRQLDAGAAHRAERALAELLSDGGLADLTQHDLQTYLWFTLADSGQAHQVAASLAAFFELAELNRYAAIAASELTTRILRTYDERGHAAGVKVATRAMDASGVSPPDLPGLDWGETMGTAELGTFDRIAATLELALAAGELRPGTRGWRLTQQRLAWQQLTMPRPDGPPLLDRIRSERMESWLEGGGQARRALAAAMQPSLAAEPPTPDDVADRMAPMQWLLELAVGRTGEPAGVPLTVTGNLARWVVQEAAERFNWWDFPERPPRSESDLWCLAELRMVLQRAGALRRSGRRLLLGTRGRTVLGDPAAQWVLATTTLVDAGEFEAAAHEAALMLLLQAGGMVEVHELVREVADVLASSGWREQGKGAPPDDHAVSHVVWSLIRRCQLWSLTEESRGPGYTTRLRLSRVGKLAGYAALRHIALRPRMDHD